MAQLKGQPEPAYLHLAFRGRRDGDAAFVRLTFPSLEEAHSAQITTWLIGEATIEERISPVGTIGQGLPRGRQTEAVGFSPGKEA